MASCNFNFDDGFIKQLEKMSNADEIVPKILKGISPIIINRQKAEMMMHKRTGSLINSIRATAVKKNKWGHYIVVRPTGIDENGVRNMEKFVYEEYGTSKQNADPIQKKVTNATSDEINQKAQEIFNQEVGI